MKRPFHFGSEGTSGFFNIPILKNRRKYPSFLVLFKLLNNKIEYKEILEKLNFRAKTNFTRNNNLLALKNIPNNYSFSSPTNSLNMSNANLIKLDIFFSI